jgi:hypothetical protein
MKMFLKINNNRKKKMKKRKTRLCVGGSSLDTIDLQDLMVVLLTKKSNG